MSKMGCMFGVALHGIMHCTVLSNLTLRLSVLISDASAFDMYIGSLPGKWVDATSTSGGGTSYDLRLVHQIDPIVHVSRGRTSEVE